MIQANRPTSVLLLAAICACGLVRSASADDDELATPGESAGQLFVLTDPTASQWTADSSGQLVGGAADYPQQALISVGNVAIINGDPLTAGTGELTGGVLIVPPGEAGDPAGLKVTRRVIAAPASGSPGRPGSPGWPGWLSAELVRNSADASATVELQIRHELNAMANITMLSERQSPTLTAARVDVTPDSGRESSPVIVVAGSRERGPASISIDHQGSPAVVVRFAAVKLAAGEQATFVHGLIVNGARDRQLTVADEAAMAQALPADWQASLANLRTGLWLLGTRELPRLRDRDLIALLPGGELTGEVRFAPAEWQTAFGTLKLGSDQLAYAEQTAPQRWLLVTRQGEAVRATGTLGTVTLSSAGTEPAEVPGERIARVALRSGDASPGDWAAQPFVDLIDSQRLSGPAGDGAIRFWTRFGEVAIAREALAHFDAHANPLGQIELVDGSVLVGRPAGERLSIASVALGQINVPIAAVDRIPGTPPTTTAPAGTIRITTKDSQILIGRFDDEVIELASPIVASVLRADQITRVAATEGRSFAWHLADGRTVAGPPRSARLAFELTAGAELSVPWSWVETITRTTPEPADESAIDYPGK